MYFQFWLFNLILKGNYKLFIFWLSQIHSLFISRLILISTVTAAPNLEVVTIHMGVVR